MAGAPDATKAGAPDIAPARPRRVVSRPGRPRRAGRARAGLVRVAVALGAAALFLDAIVAASLVHAVPAGHGALILGLAAAALVGLGALALGTAAALRLDRRRQERLAAYSERYAKARRWDEQLEALHAASLAVARENAYPAVLQTMVDLASRLARARYGALAVFDTQGRVVEFVTHGVSETERSRIGAPPRHRGLLGRLSGAAPVRLADLRQDPAFSGMPPDHPDFRAFLGVPIRWEGELLGHLYLGGHEDERPFTSEEERLLTMFALQAALAIARHRLYLAYARAVRSDERRRIAMDLHDRTLQSLYALALQLGRARRRGLADLTETMTVEAAVAAVERAMASIREVLQTLESDAEGGHPPDLVEAVGDAAALCGIDLSWHGAEALAGLDPDTASQLGMSLSEAVTNAARHGGARRVEVRSERTAPDPGASGTTLRVTVLDDGHGADVLPVRAGHGLSHIVGRMRALGGEVEIRPRFARPAGLGGAALCIRVPLGGAGGCQGEGTEGTGTDEVGRDGRDVDSDLDRR